jgi:hypothetical protein
MTHVCPWFSPARDPVVRPIHEKRVHSSRPITIAATQIFVSTAYLPLLMLTWVIISVPFGNSFFSNALMVVLRASESKCENRKVFFKYPSKRTVSCSVCGNIGGTQASAGFMLSELTLDRRRRLTRAGIGGGAHSSESDGAGSAAKNDLDVGKQD